MPLMSLVVTVAVVVFASPAAHAQPPVGALAVDGRQGDQRARGESQRPAPASSQSAPATAGTPELEIVFWQSIANSTNPAEFEAYLEQFPGGAFRALAEARLAALRGSAAAPNAAGGDGRRRTTYQLSTTIHRAPRGCGDRHSGRDRLYAVVRVVDPDLEGRIDALERRTQQLLGSISMTHAVWDLDELAERELRSGAEPLSEAERQSLARLREARRAHERDPFARFQEAERAFEQRGGQRPGAQHLGFAYEDELEDLEARLPLSGAESARLRRGRELVDTWNRLKSQRRRATNPRSMPVYENERLTVTLLEDDVFFDDRCLSASVTLDRSTLGRGSVVLGDGVITLAFAAAP